MHHQTHNRRGVNQHVFRFHVLAQRSSVFFTHADKQHIGVVTHNVGTRFTQLFCHPGGVVVINLQTRHVIFERIQPGSRQNTGLAHTAAGHLAPANRTFDVIMAADQQ
ncbi:hypothetical protein D3C73_1488420 [compost metagenome]